MPVPHDEPGRAILDPAEHDQDDQNDHDQTQAAGGSITPAPAVRPSGERTEQHENEQDDQYGS